MRLLGNRVIKVLKIQTKNTGFKNDSDNNLIERKQWRKESGERCEREVGVGGGAGQKMSKTKRGDCFESRRSVRIESQSAAVESDSALALNRTRRWPDMDTTEAKMERIKEVSQHKKRERQNAISAHIAELWWHFERI